MNVRLPNGKVINNVPDGTSKDDIMKKAISSGMATSNVFGQQPDVPQLDPSSWGSRFTTGVRDPILGASQLLQNALPESVQGGISQADKWLYENTGGYLGNKGNLNQAIQQREADYQARLPKDEGFDEARMLGNMATGLVATKGMGAPQSLAGSVGKGALISGGLGAAAPVIKDDYWKQKQSDIGISAAMGGALGPIGYGLGRIAAPKFANKQAVTELNKAGVRPTIGQTMGGFINDAEQKLTSLPFLGKSISNARKQAQTQYNKSILNKVVGPIKGKIDRVGTDGVNDAHKLISKTYKDAENMIAGIKLDDVAEEGIKLLNKNTKYLTPSEKRIFDRFVKDDFEHFLSQARGMTSKTYKEVDSSLNKIIVNNKGNSRLADSFKELQDILKEQASRNNPAYKAKLDSADAAYARLVRVENAANRSGLQGGEFTPGQMVNAIKATEQSLRKNKFSRGESLMQDYAVKGQNILGDTVPDSGTFGRAAMGGGLLTGGAFDPVTASAIASGLGLSSMLYTPTIQKALISAATKRPASAKAVSEVIGKSMPLIPAAFMMGN